MRYWYLYVGAFYILWLVLILPFQYWSPALEHWRIAAVMALGSFVAGSTPMGGGTVAFPVLVLLFHQSANIGRNFGMAIQALGMTSAMIFIFCRRIPIQTRMLTRGAFGAAAGLLLGTFIIDPHLPESFVKLLFSCIWASFGILTVIKNREIGKLSGIPALSRRTDALISFGVGLLGGLINSIIGVGIEMVAYTVLVLRYRCDLKSAVPTAVSMGAVTSLMGIGLHAALGDVGREVFFNWLAAAPIVVFGAPSGAYIVSVIPRVRTLYFVAILCLVQFVWTLTQISPGRAEWVFVGVSLAIANLAFYYLYRLGQRLPT